MKHCKIHLKQFIVIISIVFLFLTITGWFYWFQWRPNQIRRNCYREAFIRGGQWRKSNIEGNKDWGSNKEWMANPQQKINAEWGWWYPVGDALGDEYLYATCLLSEGLIEIETPTSVLLKIKGILK